MNSALCGGTANGSADFIPLGAPFTATVVFDANSVGSAGCWDGSGMRGRLSATAWRIKVLIARPCEVVAE